jgi:hypothetical protein
VAEWSDAETQLLAVLWGNSSLSASDIAKSMGRPRNSIISKVAREGLPHRLTHKYAEGEPRLVPERKRDPRARLPGLPMPQRADGTTPYADLLPWSCRFIPGEPAGAQTLYCGDPTEPGKSYCARHLRLCVTALRPPEELVAA